MLEVINFLKSKVISKFLVEKIISLSQNGYFGIVIKNRIILGNLIYNDMMKLKILAKKNDEPIRYFTRPIYFSEFLRIETYSYKAIGWFYFIGEDYCYEIIVKNFIHQQNHKYFSPGKKWFKAYKNVIKDARERIIVFVEILSEKSFLEFSSNFNLHLAFEVACEKGYSLIVFEYITKKLNINPRNFKTLIPAIFELLNKNDKKQVLNAIL